MALRSNLTLIDCGGAIAARGGVVVMGEGGGTTRVPPKSLNHYDDNPWPSSHRSPFVTPGMIISSGQAFHSCDQGPLTHSRAFVCIIETDLSSFESEREGRLRSVSGCGWQGALQMQRVPAASLCV
eukprot:2911509-Rhodomonas_salina.1